MKNKKNKGGSPRKVAIVFLAHEGITQPNVWKLWHDMCTYKDYLYYFVHCPEHYRPADPLFNWIPIPFGETKWCQSSIVYEHLRALKMSIHAISQVPHSEEDPIQCLYCMISGADIPIRSADFLFECVYKNRINFTGGRGYKSIISHTQWMILAHQEANLITYYSLNDDLSAKDNFIEIIVKILCNKRPVQSCPDESLIGNILYRILPETNRDEFIEKNSGLVTTLFKGFTHQREYIRYTNTSPINWYTYKRIIPLQENYLINTIGSTPPYIKRQSITPIQINATEIDEDTPNIDHPYTAFLPIIFYTNLYTYRHVPERERSMFFRKVSNEMPYDEITDHSYRILYSKNNDEIFRLYQQLITITPTLLIGNPNKWAHLGTSTNINYRFLCQLPERPNYADSNLNEDSIEYLYETDYNDDVSMQIEAENQPPFPITSIENLEQFKRENFNLPIIQPRPRTGGSIFVFNNKKYTISKNKNKFTITEDDKYLSTHSAKNILKNLLKAIYK